MKRRYAYLRPFSHLMGSACLIPNSPYVVQAFASKILIFDLEKGLLVKEISLPTQGLLKNFTLTQDLEGGYVTCHSEAFRIYITPQLEILEKRAPQRMKEERLCLGVYKKQEVESIRKRSLIQEILPLLFRLGNQLERSSPGEKGSVFSLLEQCRQESRPEKIEPAFQQLYQAGFSSFFVPQKSDPLMQNLYKEESIKAPILSLLSETAQWIRSLFFLSGENFLHFLPRLPPECVYGKWFSLESEWGLIDFEWSKKQLFSVRWEVAKSGPVVLRLPSSLRRYRLREGKKSQVREREEVLEVQKGQCLILDRFEK